VDAESSRRPIDEISVAERVLGVKEIHRLRMLDAATRRHEFSLAWTRLEAELKYWGIGLGCTKTRPRASSPWIANLDVGPHAAAVATERPPRQLRCWDWLYESTQTPSPIAACPLTPPANG
jgi:hypothetical protein